MLTKMKRIAARLPYAMALRNYLAREYGLFTKIAVNSGDHLEIIDRNLISDKMQKYWMQDLGVSQITANDWLRAALNFDRYIYDVEQIKARYGSLSGKSVADIGCGWGSFLLLLSREGADVMACDVASIHVEVAQMRVPHAKVIEADARDLRGFQSDFFDIVLEHDVFEHVGNYSGDTGPIGRTYEDKLKNLRELRRILKPGGHGFLSTGNYNFPWNGEVNLWLLHWFPYEYQERYLKSLNLNSDRYWLCTWNQIKQLFKEADLRIDEVYTPPHDALIFKDRIINLLRNEPHINKEFEGILLELISAKPEFMPSWMIFFSKS